MRQSIRKTPSPLVLAYRYSELRDSVVGRNFSLEAQEGTLTLAIDLTANFHARNRDTASYSDALNLVHNHQRLQFLQCSDSLVRTRLDRLWDRTRQPELRMRLELGGRGNYLYRVAAHALFAGGIQLDVQEILESRLTPMQPSAMAPAADPIAENT